MNFSQLSAFHAVMTSATLTEAAERLGRTQPAVSAAIRSLEDQLDMKLFERRGRKLVPVPEAQYLLNEASAILGQLRQARQTMRSLGDGQQGTLNVAAMPGPVSMLFPRFIATHIGTLSEIKTSLLARSSAQITELARAQSIDFGFADAPEDPDGGGLYKSDVIVGACFAALPRHHRLADEPKISVEMLSGEPMGSLQSNHVHTQDVRRAFNDRNFEFKQMVECQTFLPILQFVAAGQCSAILDPLTAIHIRETNEFHDGLSIKPLDHTLEYSYAIISPTYRPISVTAATARDAWAVKVEEFLTSIGADPRWSHHSLDDKTSA